MTNITMFNSLVRQLLIQLNDETYTHLIVNTLNTKKKIQILRSLVFGHKTSHQIMGDTGMSEPTFHRILNQLTAIGVVESKGVIPCRRKTKGGRPANVWGLV